MLGVLLMAYGSPETPDDVLPYYTHIRGGRAPRPEAVAELRERYDVVGGRTPLLAITTRVRDALARALDVPVYVGMKHWHPFIADVVPRIEADGVTDLVAVAMAPHYSRISIAGYRRALEEALAATVRAPRLRMVDSWHDAEPFLDCVARRLCDGLEAWEPGARAEVVTVFSAHSLPARIREWDDPYERELLESCRRVADRAGVTEWRFAWQSAGRTEEPWLGPDISDMLAALHAEGVRDVLSVPIGFVCDHLEVLYDIDHEARRTAEGLGMTFRRARMPNDDADFVAALAEVVRRVPDAGGVLPPGTGAAR
jgi:protoporphyrin/coproporphyrin ferrochelatase